MRLRLAGSAIIAAAVLATPAWATWGDTRWGMSVEEVLATLGPSAKRVKDQKDQRILGAKRLVTNTRSGEGAHYEVGYFFDAKSEKLVKVNMIPQVSECLVARDAFVATLGEGKGETKSQALLPDRPPLMTEDRIWPDPGGEGTVNYSSIAFGDELQYCQILFEV